MARPAHATLDPLPGGPLPVPADRARAALLAHALGDAFGRPLEFLHGADVRRTPVEVRPGPFRWTDDTHMSLYLGQAILSLDPGPFGEDAFGAALGERFVAWMLDPLTPSTAPGRTCLAGAARFERVRDWRRSGDPQSDGCGAVMRIGPLALAFEGEELLRAARVSSMVTHAHPNAVEATVAGAWILRRLLDGAALGPALVEEAAARLRGPWHEPGGTVAASLAAVVELLGEPPAPWLEEARVPLGDGGWRSGSALGLALLAVLRGGGFEAVVERAARIDGDSDSVAAIAGLCWGAAYGLEGLPAAWLDALPARAELSGLADALLGWAARRRVVGEPPAEGAGLPVHTSESSPLRVDFVTEGLPPGGGRVGLTFAPGKKGVAWSGTYAWDRDLDADLDRLVRVYRCRLLVSLVTDAELEELGIPGLVEAAAARGVEVLRAPVPDMGTPEPAAARRVVARCLAVAGEGGTVVIHCRGGLGRAGTLGACVLIGAGLSPPEALAQVRAARPGAVQNEAQESFVLSWS